MLDMSDQFQSVPTYSTDLWDYLTDMPNLPSRKDRDSLVKDAESDPSAMKRVRLWDYFFRILLEDVGRPQKKEIAELEKNLNNAKRQVNNQTGKLQKELVRLTEELEQLQDEAKHQRNEAERQVQGQFARVSERQRIIGIVAGIISLLFLSIPLCSLFFGDTWTSTLGILLTWQFCFAFVWLPVGIVAIWQLVSSSKKPSTKQFNQKVATYLDKIDQKLGPHIQKVRQDIEEYSQQLVNSQLDIEKYSQQAEERVKTLRAEITNLVNQIPSPPSDEEVDIWLKEDIQRLAGIATTRSGLQDRLINVLHADNPFCIRGPAELQSDALIPPPYRNKKSNRYKHLRARHFTIMPDNTFADFYGVYNIQFILVAENVLATYGTFYDFITGRQSGERAKVQHYPDVVTIETYRGYREIEQDDGEKIIMDNVPSLSLSLTSAEKIEVTFPDEDYFKQTNAQGFNSTRWRFDPRTTADNAIRVVREQVHEAKKQRD